MQFVKRYGHLCSQSFTHFFKTLLLGHVFVGNCVVEIWTFVVVCDVPMDWDIVEVCGVVVIGGQEISSLPSSQSLSPSQRNTSDIH